ncbi:Rho GTPase activation protein [Lentinula aff. lateritia]|uniref:Rho GTPase activation protein n=1 Tax=Lentinula aff. lateritia TaxID=2804960 RepID=A0ACC1TN65_9AGAR|nr:Rho GTPase activation protein [Lentinula aff. lateritia]
MVPELPQSPPTKANLRAWWNTFTSAQKVKREGEGKGKSSADDPENAVFGKPLKESLRYASVQISTANANGELYVWGYIPVVVAKCGLYLKENATEVEGTFRVNGSAKRMRELQTIFETPPRYGKSLDWKQSPYTAHDVASVFRRYLTRMPEPVIPYEMYHAKQPFNQEEVIATYKRLIRHMPRANQYLLLYVLDLLSVFARKSDKNLMTATNLAVIFRPGLMSHPDHDMNPKEHALSQKVLEFLIAQQDWFMLDIPPPPTNESGSPTSLVSEEDVTVFPSSDEEHQVGGGWKLVGREPKLSRRKTTIDVICNNDISPEPRRPTTQEGSLSPVAESPPAKPADPEGGALGVTRSRTLPSGRRGPSSSSESTNATEREARRVLRKQKRASSSQPGHKGGT